MDVALISLLQDDDLGGLEDLAAADRRILSRLTALTYSPDDRIAARAVRAFGRCAAVISRQDPEFVRGHLRRLFWLVNDESGGICLHAPEMIGEVIATSPGRFDEFISPLVYLLDMETEDLARFQVSILRAVRRVAQVRPQAAELAARLLGPP